MTLDEISARVDEIDRVMSGRWADDETAHVLADDLWRDVLQSIVDGTVDDPAVAAAAALASDEIGHARWCA